MLPVLNRVSQVLSCRLWLAQALRTRNFSSVEKKCYTEILNILSKLDMSMLMDEEPLSSIFKPYSDVKVSVYFTQLIHSKFILYGFSKKTCFCNFLIDLYLKNEYVDSACKIFRTMSQRDAVTWVAMISGLSKRSYELEAIHIYCKFQASGSFPTPYLFSSILSACTKINMYELGEQIHALILRFGFSAELYVCNSLISLYTRSGKLTLAENIYSEMQCRDKATFNTLISGFSKQGLLQRSFEIFEDMKMKSLKPDIVTIVTLLSSCASMGFIGKGMQLHSYVTKSGMCSDIVIEGSLLDFYVKCQDIETAHRFFLEISTLNIVLWNVMLVAYGQMGDLQESFRIYSRMQTRGLRPNQYTYPSILRTCINLRMIFQGKQVHAQITKAGFEPNVYVCSVLIDMYAKYGDLETASKISRCYSEDDIVSWTAMIAGYALHEMFIEALKIFAELQYRKIRLDNVILASAISSCTGIQALNQGCQIHSQTIVHGYSYDKSISNALICFYSRCGRVPEALWVFDKIFERDNVSWNGLISGFGQSGKCEEALKVFYKMIQAGEEANTFTYGSSISASANMVNLKLGKGIHCRIVKVGFDNEIEVCNAIISFYAKCGYIDDALRMFIIMPLKSEVSLNAMITAFSQHGYGRKAIDLFEDMKALQMVPNEITYLGILAACSHIGLVEEGLDYFRSMSEHYGMEPKQEHYACVVDILGRSGQIDRAITFIECMPIQTESMTWRALLSACSLHKNLEIGEVAAKHLLELEPNDSATYVLVSNMYAVTGKRDHGDEARELMRKRGVKKERGESWIEVKHVNKIVDRSIVVRDTS